MHHGAETARYVILIIQKSMTQTSFQSAGDGGSNRRGTTMSRSVKFWKSTDLWQLLIR